MAEGAAALAGLERPRFEARVLLAEATGLDAAALLREPGRVIDPVGFRAMVARRAKREPLAYIVGWQEFWSLRFAVSPATLIPRADSEAVIEAALAAGRRFRRVLDLGTGTGCLLLAALSELPEAWGVGVDRSAAAAALARGNAAALGLAERAAFVAGDWGAALGARFDLVLSNPPYVESAEIAGLMPEVARFEPAGALDGGLDGLDAYRRIIGSLDGLLTEDGVAVVEVGAGQAGPVGALARGAGLVPGEPHLDLGGHARAVPMTRD